MTTGLVLAAVGVLAVWLPGFVLVRVRRRGLAVSRSKQWDGWL